MKQLTLRGFDPELETRLRRLAAQEHLSLNKTVLRLLRQATGLNAQQQPNRVGDSLDAFIGSWTRKEEREFLKTIKATETIEAAFWS